jgi:tetratricopeptide (TPR) repeat protein
MAALANRAAPASTLPKHLRYVNVPVSGRSYTSRGDYYLFVTGEMDKATQMEKEVLANYPRDSGADTGLANIHMYEGQYERAAEADRDALRKMPDNSSPYRGLALALLGVQKFNKAKQTLEQAHARKLDHYFFHITLYALAFLERDSG